MSKSISFGKIEVNIVSTMEKTYGAPDPETPFWIAVFGNFSGRTNRGIINPALNNLKPLLVDQGNLDEILEKLKIENNLPILDKESPSVTIGFFELDDFNPDTGDNVCKFAPQYYIDN